MFETKQKIFGRMQIDIARPRLRSMHFGQSRVRIRDREHAHIAGCVCWAEEKTQRLYWPYSVQTAKLQPEEKQSNSPCYK